MANEKAITTTPSEAELDALANFAPAFDKPTMFGLEKVAGGQSIGIQRRIALAVLTMSADELTKVSLKDQSTYAEMRKSVEGFKTHAQGMLEAAEAAAIRIAIADIGEPVQSA
jgi:hypothetical protein